MPVRVLSTALILILIGCSSRPKPPTSGRPAAPAAEQPASRTVTVRDPELERRIARIELQLIEKEALVSELQSRLDDTRAEVVRTMARLQTAASRAEAASGMAEAEVALQSLRLRAGHSLPITGQVAKLIQQSTAEFNRQNFGGALYLATQAKSMAASYRPAGAPAALRSGETPFALPIQLKASGRGNVREGPATTFPIAFTVDAGSALIGYSYTDDWVRVSDEIGRSGWIVQTVVTRP